MLKDLECFTQKYVEKADQYYIQCIGKNIETINLRTPIINPNLFLGLTKNNPSFYRYNSNKAVINLIPRG